MILKQFFHRWLKVKSRVKSGVCYNSIEELPIWNWFKVFETNELKHIIIEGVVEDTILKDTWNKLFSEYIDIFGLDDNLVSHIKHEKKMVLLELEYAIKRRASDLFKIELEIENTKEKQSEKVQSDFMQVIAQVENALNRNINEKKISVRKFYTYLKQLQKNGN
jgi:hypothetical protein